MHYLVLLHLLGAHIGCRQVVAHRFGGTWVQMYQVYSFWQGSLVRPSRWDKLNGSDGSCVIGV